MDLEQASLVANHLGMSYCTDVGCLAVLKGIFANVLW